MRHMVWSVGGGVYDPERAAAQVRADASAFVERVAAREGLCVCALDTELLGDWWREGVDWLATVLECCEERGVEVLPLEEAVERHPPHPAPALPPTSWGQPRDLSTWSAPGAGGLAWAQRAAELRALAPATRPGERALRELLALQSSDWAFLITRGTAGPYPRERFQGHLAGFESALAAPEAEPALRNLAPQLPLLCSP
jgi:1,4-alpha-glucan branching enzyme